MKAMRKSGQRSAVGGQLQPVEVFILAGGLSARMGRNKARLRLRGRTLLAWVRAAARATGWPVRVIRRDLVPRCGPLGGVWTALRRSRAERLVFLSCDMPFVTPELIRAVAQRKGRGVFVETGEGWGFPSHWTGRLRSQWWRPPLRHEFSRFSHSRGVCARVGSSSVARVVTSCRI